MRSEWWVVAKKLISTQIEETYVWNREKKHDSISRLTKQQQTYRSKNALQALSVIDGWFKSVL